MNRRSNCIFEKSLIVLIILIFFLIKAPISVKASTKLVTGISFQCATGNYDEGGVPSGTAIHEFYSHQKPYFLLVGGTDVYFKKITLSIYNSKGQSVIQPIIITPEKAYIRYVSVPSPQLSADNYSYEWEYLVTTNNENNEYFTDYSGKQYFTVTDLTYNVHYNANGGKNAPSPQVKIHGKTLALSSTKPTRIGYTFMGWSTSKSATNAIYNVGGNYTSNCSTTLYAVWKENTYTVTYNANSGIGVPPSQIKTYGKSLILSNIRPTKEGYDFIGWSTSSSATSATYSAGGNYTNNSSVTLYAVWKIKKYTVAYNENGGVGIPSSQVKTHGKMLILSDVKPTRTGHTFMGWSTNKSAASAAYRAGGTYTGNNSITLYAVWKADTYTVTYNANGGTKAPSPQTKTYGKILTLSNTKPTRTGYTFLGWSASKTAASAAYKAGGNYTDNKGAILYAVWKKNQTSTSKPSDNSISTKKKKQTIKTSAASYTIYGSKGVCLVNVKRTGDGKLTYSSSNKKAAAVSSNGKITARSYGKTTITIKAAATKKYLAVSKKVTVTVVPEKAELKSVKSPAKGVIKFTWKKDRTVTGYEVYISPNKKFSQGTKSKLFKQSISSKKISKCPGKRNFYIKIRSYKTVGKMKYYGPWSEVKKVKVR